MTTWLVLGACAVPPTPEPDPDAWALGAETAAEAAYASCASCHLADGAGRADGSIPRLAGQLAVVVEAKLVRIASGELHLPVMLPFAGSLDAAQRELIAGHLEALPTPSLALDGEPVAGGEPLYAAHCSACHGASGEGNAALLAPRLCGQHPAYVSRRLATQGERGDADAAMSAVVATLDDQERAAIADHLGRCGP